MAKACGQCDRPFNEHTEIVERDDVEDWRSIPHACNAVSRLRNRWVVKREERLREREGRERSLSGAHIEDEAKDREGLEEMLKPKRHAPRPGKHTHAE